MVLRLVKLQVGGDCEVFDCVGGRSGTWRGGRNWRFTRGNRPPETYQRVYGRDIHGFLISKKKFLRERRGGRLS